MIAAQLAEQRKAKLALEAAERAVRVQSDQSGTSDPVGLFYDQLMEMRSGSVQEDDAREIGTCAICGNAMAARRQIKTLPCGHVFHFACIDSFHREKLRKEKCVDLPCYICGTATHQSIDSIAAEMRKRREAATAQIKAELAANPVFFLETVGESVGSRTVSTGAESLESVKQDLAKISLNDAQLWKPNRSPDVNLEAENGNAEVAPPLVGASRRAASRRRNGGALSSLARATNCDRLVWPLPSVAAVRSRLSDKRSAHAVALS